MNKQNKCRLLVSFQFARAHMRQIKTELNVAVQASFKLVCYRLFDYGAIS